MTTEKTQQLPWDYVRQFQAGLILGGYDPDDTLYGDGVIGDETVAATRRFQEDWGLEPTGIIDEQTGERMYLEEITISPSAIGTIKGQQAYIALLLKDGLSEDRIIDGEPWMDQDELLATALLENGKPYPEMFPKED